MKRYLSLFASLAWLAACGSSPSFVEQESDAKRDRDSSVTMPEPIDSQDATAPVPDPGADGMTTFELALKTRADQARVSEPVDFIISLDTSNSITRHADALAQALGPFLAGIDRLGIKMNIQLVTLDEYLDLLAPDGDRGAMAPGWFFGRGSRPTLATAFPSARVFHSSVPSEVAELTALIREKARQPSQISTEPMYCALETFLSLVGKDSGRAKRDRHVLTVTDEDNDWQFKTFDLAGNLKTTTPIACGEQRKPGSNDEPYRYDREKRWTAYTYQEKVAAQTSYRYDAVIKTYGPCQQMTGSEAASLARYNLYTNSSADQQTNVYSCLDHNQPATYNCQETGGSWSSQNAGNFSGHQVCNEFQTARCTYSIDGVSTVENVSVARARELISQGASCQVTGGSRRDAFPTGSVSGVFGYQACRAVTCSVASFKRVSVTESNRGSQHTDCQQTSVNHSYRTLVAANFSGNQITSFSLLDRQADEVAVSRRAGIRNVSGAVCAHQLPASLPDYVFKEDAAASTNGTRNQAYQSAVRLSRSELAARLGIAEALLVSVTETPLTQAERTETFLSTYELGNLPAGVSLASRTAMRKGEAEADALLAGYRHQRASDVEIVAVYRDGGRYVDEARRQAAISGWQPELLQTTRDVLGRNERTTFHALAKTKAEASCQGVIGRSHIDLAEQSHGAVWDICQATPASLSEFFDQLLRRVIETVVREYRLSDFAPGATVVEVRRRGSDEALKVGADYDLVTLSDGSPGISFKGQVKAGDVFDVRARLP